MLTAKNICVSFKSERQEKIFGTTRKQVLFDVNLSLPKGCCLGILAKAAVVNLHWAGCFAAF